MTPPDEGSNITLAFAPETSTSVEARAAEPADPPGDGRIHAVPVGEYVAHSGPVAEALYRVFEIVVASLGLIVGLPIMLAEAVLIRLDSPGPALFLHTRPGRSKKVRGRDLIGRTDLIPPPGGFQLDILYYVPTYFRMAKFRTMYQDAPTRFPELYAYDFGPGEFRRRYGTLQHDPRVTRVGEILRKLSVDELPNLWSVLVGDMRLVGPRPEAAQVLQYYTPEEMYKFACKPGITGLAQINGRGLLNFGETIDWDLKYLRNRSVWMDLKIIFVTVKYVVARHGAF
jgi:lipopolysaccharide/colanic/teichoic acid biosynthesis glycosyltransferase